MATSILHALKPRKKYGDGTWDFMDLEDETVALPNNTEEYLEICCTSASNMPGDYLLYGQVEFPASATGDRIVAIVDNYGVDIARTAVRASQSGTTVVSAIGVASVEADAYKQYYLQARQTSGSSMNIGGSNTLINMTRI